MILIDDRTFALVLAVLATSTLVVLAAGLFKFDVHPGFWAVPGGIITLITVLSNRRNGKAEDSEQRDAELARDVLKDYLNR